MQDSEIEKPKLLLTGFGPFPGTPDNASAKLVEHAARQAADLFPHIEVHHDVLPTEWQAAPERLAKLYQDIAPNVALHFGVSNLSRGFTIETIARNTCCATLDAAGCSASGPVVIPGAASEYRTRLPIETIHQRLTQRDIPVELSTSAGTYLCNTIFYLSLANTHPKTIAGFIHIPENLPSTTHPEKTNDGLSWEAAISGTVDIIGACLTAHGQQSG